MPTENIAYLYEKKLNGNAILVSSSRPVPSDDEDVQPPHRQAKKYYTNCIRVTGSFEITMEHPKASAPEPLVIEIGSNRGRIRRAFFAGAGIATGAVAPRAGCLMFLEAPGAPSSADELTLAKAIAFFAYLKSGRHGYAELVAVRRDPLLGRETVVCDLIVEVSQDRINSHP